MSNSFVDTILLHDYLERYNSHCSFFASQSGPDIKSESTRGVNFRALDDLFHISQSRQGIISYQLSLQMIEIYNEQVRDLLVADGSDRRYPFSKKFFLLILENHNE